MKIEITQPEIEQLIREGLNRSFKLNSDEPLVIDFTAGRGDKGLTATIDIPYLGLSTLNIGDAVAAPAPAVKAAPAVKSVVVAKTEIVADEAPAAEVVVDETPAEAAAPVNTPPSLFASFLSS